MSIQQDVKALHAKVDQVLAALRKPERRLLPIADLALELGCSVRTVHYRIKAGEWRAFKHGKKLLLDVDEVQRSITKEVPCR